MKMHAWVKAVTIGALVLGFAGMAQAEKHAGKEKAKKDKAWVEAKVDAATTKKLNQLCQKSTLESDVTCLAKGQEITAIAGASLKKPLEASETYGLYWVPSKKSDDYKFVFRVEKPVAAAGANAA